MNSTYRLRASELSTDFIKGLKATYKNREIEITVHEILDETDYLLSTEANREHLLSAIKDIKENKNLVYVSLDSIQ